jgi:hypothetical protein
MDKRNPQRHERFFFVCLMQQFRCELQEYFKMNESLRDDCLMNIRAALARTSAFRWRKAKQWPDDPRNLLASSWLKTIMNNSTELSDQYWEKLESVYIPDSDSWRIALNQAANNVGFSNKSNNFSFFLRDLVGLLPTSVAA